MDAGMLEKVLSHIHNWFMRDTFAVKDCIINGGQLPASVSSQIKAPWYRIQGSYQNDGIHGASDVLTDETFSGTISNIVVPKALASLIDDIAAWEASNATAAQAALESPYSSESFGGYSYSLRDDLVAQNASGGLTGWQAAFASQLNPWRKMY